jgi:hypothetical protein
MLGVVGVGHLSGPTIYKKVIVVTINPELLSSVSKRKIIVMKRKIHLRTYNFLICTFYVCLDTRRQSIDTCSRLETPNAKTKLRSF